MKKSAIYLSILSLLFLAACQGRQFDSRQELEELTDYWATEFVNHALSRVIDVNQTETHTVDNMQWTSSIQLKDTIYRVFRDEYTLSNGDSVNVTSRLLQIKDSIVVVTEGYIYSDLYKTHLYTVGPGIINYNGKFHIDFCLRGWTNPWAWGEVKYSKIIDDTDEYYYPYTQVTEVGWY